MLEGSRDAATGGIRRVALLGNHLPRRCGIATFTTDLSDAIAALVPDLNCFVLAMNDGRHKYAYPGRVRFELADTDADSYLRAADFLNVNAISIALEHFQILLDPLVPGAEPVAAVAV